MPEMTPEPKSMEDALKIFGHQIIDINWTVYNSYAEQLKKPKFHTSKEEAHDRLSQLYTC